MNRFTNISNNDLSAIIENWIKNQRDRQILKRKLIDGITYEQLSEEFELSVKQIYRIVNKYGILLYQLCNEWATISP